MAAIFAVSSLPGKTVSGPVTAAPVPTSYPMKLAIAHVAEFAILAVLAYRVFSTSGLRPVAYVWGATLLLTVGYAGTDELHQAFVPGRVPAWEDIGYDSLGAAAGLIGAETAARVLRGTPVRWLLLPD
jgi:VanZ family protein